MLDVVTKNPLNAETGWDALALPVTPTDSFFKRNHEEFPELGPDHRVEVNGHFFSVDDLKALGEETFEVTFECAGNARLEFSPIPPGTGWGIKAVSNANWTGVPLSKVLAQAPCPGGTVEVVFAAADGEGDKLYARSLPLDGLEPVWLVWGMNGEPLSVQHGGPIRVLVGGWYGMASVKWLRRVYSVSEPFAGYYQVEDYQFKPPGGEARAVGRMLVKSLIVAPREGSAVSSPVEIRGWAWTGQGTINGVQVEVGGTTHSAVLEPERGRYAWRGWSLKLDLPAGQHTAIARARDTSGDLQPLQAPWNEQGYENNSAHQVSFTVS